VSPPPDPVDTPPTPRALRRGLWLVVLAGGVLHGITFSLMTFDSDAHRRFGMGLQLGSCAPYALAAVLQLIGLRTAYVFGGGLLALAIDVAGFLSVVVWPQDAQAPLILLFLPFWTTVVAFPVGWIVAMIIVRYRQRRAQRTMR
jgi:hypothetical protein